MRGDALRRLAAKLDRWLEPRPPYRYRWGNRADALVVAGSRVRLALYVAWLALRGDETFFRRWEARHIHGVERFVGDYRREKHYERLVAALEAEPHPGLREELGAHRLRVKRLREEVRTAQVAAERRNRDLAALHLVWCDGGCPGGVGGKEMLDKATVEAAVRNTRRLVRWWNNAASRRFGNDWEVERVRVEAE